MKNTIEDESSLLKQKVVLITGASRGIGNITAKKYIDSGAHVIALGRDLALLEQLDDYAKSKDSSITMVQLDLQDMSKIPNLAKIIKKRFGKLDVFIANAAVLGEISPLDHYDPAVWGSVMNINLNANWYLLRVLTPLLRLSNLGAEAIFVSCSMSANHDAYWGAYAVSKAALEKLALIYKEENKNNDISVSILNPGAHDTKLRKKAFPDLCET